MFPVAVRPRRIASYCAVVTMVTVATLVSVTSSLPTITIPSLVRPDYCAAPNNSLFVDCFMCGRLMQSELIYHGCCALHQPVIIYCDELLA